MKIIHVGFSRPKSKLGILGKLIQWVEGTDFSHTYIRWTTKNGEEQIYEATFKGVDYQPASEFQEKNVIVEEYKFILSNRMHENLVRFCNQNRGRSYGYGQLLGILLARKLGLSWNPMPSSWICVEVVLRMFSKVMGVKSGLNPNLAGLKDLKLLLMRLKGK